MEKHFLRDTDFSHAEVSEIFSLAQTFKKNRRGHIPPTLRGQSWGLIFFKNSTRTRVSFEVGISELGGHPVVLDAQRTQISRGETIADTARVLSRYLNGVVIRCFEHAYIEEFAENASIPVINGLTDFLHPCQTYTDAFTMAERWCEGSDSLLDALVGRKIAFFGDCSSNMAYSLVLTCRMLGMEVSLSGPEAYRPGPEIDEVLAAEGMESYHFTTDPYLAAKDADVLYTDVFVSMGDEEERETRIAKMMPYQVNSDLMRAAKKDALFMHCLPAHAGEEVSQEVLDLPASIIFDQAENRLHVQKAIMSVLSEAHRSSRP